MLQQTRRQKSCGSRLDSNGYVVLTTDLEKSRESRGQATKQSQLETRERDNQQRARYLCSPASQNATRPVCGVSYWSDRRNVVTSALPLLGNHAYNVASGVRRTRGTQEPRRSAGSPGTSHQGVPDSADPTDNINFSGREAKKQQSIIHRNIPPQCLQKTRILSKVLGSRGTSKRGPGEPQKRGPGPHGLTLI